MRILRSILILTFLICIFTDLEVLATDVIDGKEINGRHNKGQTQSRDTESHFKFGDTLLASVPHGKNDVKSSVSKTQQEEIIDLCNAYTSQGISFADAVLRSIKEIRESKDTSFEKRLRALGCVQWGDISEITSEILETVEASYDSSRGPFVLKPGLTIVYVSDKA